MSKRSIQFHTVYPCFEVSILSLLFGVVYLKRRFVPTCSGLASLEQEAQDVNLGTSIHGVCPQKVHRLNLQTPSQDPSCFVLILRPPPPTMEHDVWTDSVAGIVQLVERRTDLRAGLAHLVERRTDLRAGLTHLVERRTDLRAGLAQLVEHRADLELGLAQL